MSEILDTDIIVKSEFSRDRWPFYWLTRVVGRYLEQLEQALKKIGLDVSQWRVLSCLAEDQQISISEIAELAIVKLPTMMKIVQRMEADELVTMSRSASDGRVTQVELTEQGLRAREAALAIARRIHDRAFAGIAAERETELNGLLRTVFLALEV